jgi:hypothetical protein
MALDQAWAYVNLAYFALIALLSIGIYFETRATYAFSQHRGIGYFKNAFLFFGLIYACRFYVSIVGFSQGLVGGDLYVSLRSVGVFMVSYFSVLAILNLMASFSWKELGVLPDNFLNVLALLVSCIVFFVRLPSVFLVFGLVAALFLALKAYDSYRNGKAIFTRMFLVYMLLVFFWFYDLVPLTQEILSPVLLLAGYVASVGVFAYLNYRMKKVLSPD